MHNFFLAVFAKGREPLAARGLLLISQSRRSNSPRRKPQVRVRCTDSARKNISREPCREELSTLVGEPPRSRRNDTHREGRGHRGQQ